MNNIIILKFVIYLIILCEYKYFKVNTFNLSPKSNYIFTYPKSTKTKYESSYFGYSINLREKSLMIGAPRAQSNAWHQSENNQTGGIYKCDIINGTCISYDMDTKGNENNYQETNKYNNLIKDNQWFGAVMDGFGSENDPFMTCAPNVITEWKSNKYQPDAKHFYMFHGLCFIALNTIESKPKVVQKFTDLRYKTMLTYHKYGQQGFSLHITNNTQEIIMGAPGVYDWRGSVVRYIRSNTYNAATNNYNVDAIEPLTSEDTSSYFGYAVTTGYFKPKKLLYVASAPRGNSLKGKVLIFDFNESKEFLKKTIIVHKIFFGVQIGEYFGYTLLSDDFNKDGLVDLVISAPLHSRDSSFDNGMVYVYQNNNNMTFLETKPLVSNYITNGRFGMSLGKIGDVDQDGFNDLAVGAPFEDDGAVYIFHGSQYGLLSKPSQRIVPTPADQPLTFGGSYMFGMSISRGIDIDGNGFNDITIGAPNAELVYIYKSYPAINIISSIQSVAKEIELNATEFTIKACWRYYSKMIIPFNIKLIISIILDYESERVKFSINDTNELQFTDSIKTNDECREYNVSLTFSTADIFKPVVLEMSYDLDTKISHSSNFCKECVVIHPNDPKIVKNKVSISTGCKNIVCIADLRIRNSFNVVIDPYVIGSTKTILIWYFIENLGETAFSTQINISVPHIVTFSTIPTNCKLYGSSLRCELGKEWALYNGQQENISIVIDTSEIYGKQLKITSKVSSSGNESNADDNMIENTIHLKEFSEIEINGKSTLPSDSINVDSARLSNITHSLQIRNGGPSNIKQMMINFYIPLVYFIRGENKKKIKLIENENIVSKALYNNKQLNILSDISKKYHTTHNNTFLNFDSNFQNVPINRSIIFNCEDKNVYACLKGTVHVQDFKAKNTPINIEITFSIDLSQIDKLYSDKKSLFVLITSSEIIKDDDDGNTMNITKFNPYTVFKQSIPDTPIWIYVVSILAGTLGLILMYYALYKMGFFRRKTNEHMENVKIQREIQNLE